MDALTQMPSYVKFMKWVLSNKKKLKDCEMVTLNEECNVIFHKKLPPKLEDPRSFHLPCIIRSCNFKKSLCDLAINVNLMSLSMYRKMGLGEAKPTIVSL